MRKSRKPRPPSFFFENWKQVPEAPNYWVSKDGWLYNRRSSKVRRGSLDAAGYYVLDVKQRGKKRILLKVHRLVCALYNGPCPENMNVCRHLNGIRGDNRAENLAWGTPKDNGRDTRRQNFLKKYPEYEELYPVQASWHTAPTP